MITYNMYKKIYQLWEKDKNKSKISRMTGHDRKTINKVVEIMGHGKEIPNKKAHPKLLDEYKDKIIEWKEDGLTSIRIHEKLLQLGKKVGYSTVKDFVASLKKQKKVFIKMQTKPGEEAQVDFGEIKFIDSNGKKRKAYIFNMRLSYSRLDYYEAVYDQKVETFIQCHINAFKYFGGVAEIVKLDNLKSGVTEVDKYEPIYQAHYENFSKYYGFLPLACRPRKPNDKGKVESGVKFAKGNFMLGRDFKNLEDLNLQLKNWQDNYCNKRLHGTIRKIPRNLFEEKEKHLLKKLPDFEYKIPFIGIRKVQNDSHIYVRYNQYSVPFEYVGEKVTLEINGGILRIYYQAKEIAIHKEIKEEGEISTNISHYPKYKVMTEEENYKKFLVKTEKTGPYVKDIFLKIKKTFPKQWHRIVRGILSLKKKYSNETINLSCKRALKYKAYSYRIVRNICKEGLYNLPLE